MNFNALLEIVISLAALFWLLSTVSSFIVEAINSLLRNIRADALERFVCEMVLGDGAVRHLYAHWPGRLSLHPAADPLGLLSHGLVQSLRKPDVGAAGAGSPPSYMPAQVFAKALMDRLSTLAHTAGAELDGCLDFLAPVAGPARVAPAPGLILKIGTARTGVGLFANALKVVNSVMTDTPAAAAAQLAVFQADLNAQATDNAISALALPAPALAKANASRDRLDSLLTGMREVLNELATKPSYADKTLEALFGSPQAVWLLLMRSMPGNAAGLALVEAVRAVVEHGHLPLSLQEALRPIVANANFDLEQLRKGIEDWYDQVMERATGWFKRHTAWLLGVVGLALALAFRINPLLIAHDLSQDPTLRAAGVAFGDTVVKAKGDAVLGQQIMFFQASERLGWADCVNGIANGAKPAPAAVAASSAASKPFTTRRSCDNSEASVKALAFEMQPFLLSSGHYVGLLSTVGASVSAGSTVTETERTLFLANVCTAWLEAEVAAGRDAATRRRQLEIPASSRWDSKNDMACKTVRDTFGTDNNRAKDGEKFWASSAAWDPKLGTALWATLMARDETPREDSAQKLHSAYKHAVQRAKVASDSANEFLTRIPSLGWTQATWWHSLRCSTSREQYAIDQSALARQVRQMNAWQVGGGLLLDVIGFLLCAVMVSFGAAFWFDLLSKAINRRITGPKPDTLPTSP